MTSLSEFNLDGKMAEMIVREREKGKGKKVLEIKMFKKNDKLRVERKVGCV